MKRIGVRKLAEKTFNSKPVQKTDEVMNKIVTTPGTLLKRFSEKTGLKKLTDKLKIDVSGKQARKTKNNELNAKIEAANKKLAAQEVKDIESAKDFERQKQDDAQMTSKNIDATSIR